MEKTMKQRLGRILISAAFLLASSVFAHAQCIEDPRVVTLGKGLDGKDIVVRLKSYLCRAGEGPNEPQIKVEFHQLSEPAASILLMKVPPPKALKAAFGTPVVVENAVFKSYVELLTRFGEAHQDSRFLSLSLAGENPPLEDTRRKIRTLSEPGLSNYPFPSPPETKFLDAKVIPPGFHFDYQTSCADESFDTRPDGSIDCKRWNVKEFTTVFWRGMTSSDLDNLRKDIAASNRRVGKKPQSAEGASASAGEKYLRMMKHIAGEQWPEDLVILQGTKIEGEGCGDGDNPPATWSFEFYPRIIKVDAAAITNVTKAPITIDTMFGNIIASPSLRAATLMQPLAAGSDAIAGSSLKLAPGQTALVPIRIFFEKPYPGAQVRDAGPDEVRAKVGANGFTGNTDAFGPPIYKDYAFGPEIGLNGFTLGGKRVDLSARAENIVDVTMGEGYGSCPYLLSWDDREWVNHGKVVHKGQGKAREYSETKTFAGFSNRFRLEEREPEIAYIDHAELAISLKNGETLLLKTNHEKLAARDGGYAKFYWGEAIEFSFARPEGVAEADVIESRLTLTGYYERYSSLLAENAGRPSALNVGP